MNKLMLKVFTVLLLFIFISSRNFAQADTNSVKPYIIACADSLMKGLSSPNDTYYKKFVNDKVNKTLGNIDDVIKEAQQVARGEASKKEDSTRVIKMEYAFKDIRQVVKTINGYQCIIAYKWIAVSKKKKTALIMFMHGSSDSLGKHWNFTDIGEGNFLSIMISDLDKRLIIPKNNEPVENL